MGCHPQTVRERLRRFNTHGLEGLGDRPGSGRRPACPRRSAVGSWLWLPRRHRGG
ncbi:helix-turn-helix domain-containing protein [Nocardia sp. NPDC052278]|uniref:helix-turn-helix domain-containing protein n=1 Tax=unclassified Nocardia TaxID=2637762 RepID=UPI0036BB87ED